MKLWKKNIDPDNEIEAFTVGNDHIIDQKLVPYDCDASIAHAKMLNKVNLLSTQETAQLTKALKKIKTLHAQGKFEINQSDEDCHTAIENYLTKKCGTAGKRIHTARSRNDQVLTAFRLYEKDALNSLESGVKEIIGVLAKIIKTQGTIPLPGYSHMQKAMPSSIQLWLGAYEDAFEDLLPLISAQKTMIDQNPLGTAAGFGVPELKIDRGLTTKELKFKKVLKNPIYAQMSRGLFEGQVINILTSTMLVLNKLTTDLMMFSMKEFNYISIPEKYCTGSSIMPQKKNPDVLELVRAKYHVILGEEFKVKSMSANLISGYNRDMQLTKEPVFTSIDITLSSLSIMAKVLKGMKINEKACQKAMTEELFATAEAYKLVKKGVPFREAYKKVGEKYTGKP